MVKEKIYVSNAIRRLLPNVSGWSVTNDADASSVVWNNAEVTEPTLTEIETMRQTMADEVSAEEYKDWRVNGKYEVQNDEAGEPVKVKILEAYPSIGEQLDKLYHDMLADKGDKTGTWFAAIKAVKDATPKP